MTVDRGVHLFPNQIDAGFSPIHHLANDADRRAIGRTPMFSYPYKGTYLEALNDGVHHVPQYNGFCAATGSSTQAVANSDGRLRSGTLSPPNGGLKPFAVMDQVYETMVGAFPTFEEWQNLDEDARLRQVRAAVAQGFASVRLPPVEVSSEFLVFRPPYYNNQRWAMTIDSGSLASGFLSALADWLLPDRTYWRSRDQVLRWVAHHSQHALQTYFRLSWIAGHPRDVLSVSSNNGVTTITMRDGQVFSARSDVWKVARSHSTTDDAYIESLLSAPKVDRYYRENQIRSGIHIEQYGDWARGVEGSPPGAEYGTQEGDPRGSENDAERAAWKTLYCDRRTTNRQKRLYFRPPQPGPSGQR